MKFILLIIVITLSINTAIAENNEFEILYILDDSNDELLSNPEIYKIEEERDVENLNKEVEKIIEKSLSSKNYKIKSSIIHVNFENVSENVSFDHSYKKEWFLDSETIVRYVRKEAINDTNDLFLPIIRDLELLENNNFNFLKINATNNQRYNYFLNSLYQNITKKNPDLIVVIADKGASYDGTNGKVSNFLTAYSYHECEKTLSKSLPVVIDNVKCKYNEEDIEEQVFEENKKSISNQENLLKLRKTKLTTKLIILRKDRKTEKRSIDLLHEMGHTFSLYHDPMTSYKNNFIDTKKGLLNYYSEPNEYKNIVSDYILTDNPIMGYYHPEGKGFMYVDPRKDLEYYSIMSYPHYGEYGNAPEKQRELRMFSNPSVSTIKYKNKNGDEIDLDIIGGLNSVQNEYREQVSITIPYGSFTAQEGSDLYDEKYYNEDYPQMEADFSSNTSAVVDRYLKELTKDSLELNIQNKINNPEFDYEIRKLKTFNNEVIIDEIIDDSSQNIIHTSLLDNTYKLGNDNVVYLSTGNDSYDVDDTEGNIFIIEENEIQDLIDLSLEQTSKTTLNNFNSKSKLFIPIGGELNFCVKVPSYEKYKENNSLYQNPDQDNLISEYDSFFSLYGSISCSEPENASSNFTIVFTYNNKSIEVEISPKSGFNKLLFNKYNDNIYRDNNPLGNPQLLPQEEYEYDYYEFTIMKMEDRFSDTVDENDDNDKNILPTHPSTEYQDNITGSDGNDIIGNPDFTNDEWVNHQPVGDTYNPKGGNDFIYGTPYSDTYIFDSDFGFNVIYDRAAINKETSKNNSGFNIDDYDLIHLVDLNTSDVMFERHQYDLVVTSMIRENNIIIVEDFFKVTDVVWPYQYEANQIEFFKFSNGDIKTAEEITDEINNVINTYGDNILWGNIDTNNTFNPIIGKNEYVGGLKKDKYILDINSDEAITIRDRGGYDTLYIKSDEDIETARLNFVKNGDDLNIYYKYKKLAIIKDNFAEEFYKERNIEDLEYMDYNEYRPEYNVMTNQMLKYYGYLTLNKGNPNQTFEDPAEVFKRSENIEYFKPGVGNDIFEKIEGGDVIILNLNEGMKTIKTFEEN